MRIFSCFFLFGVLAIFFLYNCSSSRKKKDVRGMIVVKGQENAKEKENSDYLVVFSIDGFRWDYVQKFGATNIQKLASGVSSSIIPSYPSKTFPNHYTLVTGMYPSKHGLVDNTFYDPEKDFEKYKIADRSKVQDGSWYFGKPLWQLAQENGLISASFFWVGSEADINGTYPTYRYNFNKKISLKDRIDQVVNWINYPKEKRPHLIFLYYGGVDHKGHRYGVNSKELEKEIKQTDSLVGYLLEELKKTKKNVNLILTTDHGMTNIDKDSIIYISDLASEKQYKVVSSNATQALFYCDTPNQKNILYEKLKKSKDWRFGVFLKDSFPSGLNYRKNKRIGDIILMTHPPYIIQKNRSNPTKIIGMHGYDPSHKDMHGIFYAYGPHFKKKLKVPSFKNIHLYPLIAKFFNLPIPNYIDGKKEVLEGILEK